MKSKGLLKSKLKQNSKGLKAADVRLNSTSNWDNPHIWVTQKHTQDICLLRNVDPESALLLFLGNHKNILT